MLGIWIPIVCNLSFWSKKLRLHGRRPDQNFEIVLGSLHLMQHPVKIGRGQLKMYGFTFPGIVLHQHLEMQKCPAR